MAGNCGRGRWLLRSCAAVITALGLVSSVQSTFGSLVVDFEDLPLAPESYYNGSDGAGGFTSNGTFFNNDFDDRFPAWSGWSYSNVTDNATPGYGNQYSAVTAGGADGSSNYAVGFASAPGEATIDLPASMFPQSMLVTNTTYAYLSMLHGDQFAKQFGGPAGDDPDYFLLTITGLDGGGKPMGAVEVYLADYRFEDSALDTLVGSWTEVDLSALSSARKLSFGLESTDVGQFGMNTPAYFAVDNLHLVPEPTVLVLLAMGALAACRRRIRR